MNPLDMERFVAPLEELQSAQSEVVKSLSLSSLPPPFPPLSFEKG